MYWSQVLDSCKNGFVLKSLLDVDIWGLFDFVGFPPVLCNVKHMCRLAICSPETPNKLPRHHTAPPSLCPPLFEPTCHFSFPRVLPLHPNAVQLLPNIRETLILYGLWNKIIFDLGLIYWYSQSTSALWSCVVLCSLKPWCTLWPWHIKNGHGSAPSGALYPTVIRRYGLGLNCTPNCLYLVKYDNF